MRCVRCAATGSRSRLGRPTSHWQSYLLTRSDQLLRLPIGALAQGVGLLRGLGSVGSRDPR